MVWACVYPCPTTAITSSWRCSRTGEWSAPKPCKATWIAPNNKETSTRTTWDKTRSFSSIWRTWHSSPSTSSSPNLQSSPRSSFRRWTLNMRSARKRSCTARTQCSVSSLSIKIVTWSNASTSRTMCHSLRFFWSWRTKSMRLQPTSR